MQFVCLTPVSDCDVRLNNGTNDDGSQEDHGTSGSSDGTAGGPDCDWKEHMRYFRRDMWWSSGQPPCFYLEAIGWVCNLLTLLLHSNYYYYRHIHFLGPFCALKGL